MPDFGEKWELIKPLKEGGQAHTFLVRRKDNPEDGKEYVLKRLKNLTRIERFNREIEVCSRLDHPNVLRIVDHGVDSKRRPFLVTQYCEGGALSDRRMPAGSVLQMLEAFAQVCAGVAYAHRQGVFHRDIKPENIYLRNDGTLVVGDFGLCFVDDDERLTLTEEVVGSRFYCAPELRDGRVNSRFPPTAADVYSLAKMLYWMLSGEVFDREDHRKPEYRLGQADPGAPEYELVNQLLDQTIVADPTRRVQGAEVLLEKVHGLISVIRAGGHAITLSVPHRCLFCAQGEYKVVANALTPTNPRTPPYQFAASQLDSIFGWRAPGSPAWLVLVCEACGHIQIFRPDLVNGGLARWRK